LILALLSLSPILSDLVVALLKVDVIQFVNYVEKVARIRFVESFDIRQSVYVG